MPDEKGPVRPQQVTFAGLAVIGGSLVLLVAAFDQISSLHSLDTRTAVERLIGDEPTGLGITVEGWLRVLKVVGMVTGACAAASVILGWQALQRSRAARIVLAIVAGPMVIAGLAIEPLFAILVAVAVVVLWLPTASAWFDPQARLAAPSESGPPPTEPPTGPPTGPPAPADGKPQAPPPYAPPPGRTSPYASPDLSSYPPPQAASPYPAAASPASTGTGTGPASAAGRRPGPVTAAAVITFVLSGLSAALGVLLAIVGGTMAQDMLDELDKHGYDTGGFSAHELGIGLAVLGVIVVVAAIVAIVAAAFVLRRSAGARVVLTVMSGLCIVLSVLAVTSVVSLVTLAGAVAVIVMLHRRPANDWFTGRA